VTGSILRPCFSKKPRPLARYSPPLVGLALEFPTLTTIPPAAPLAAAEPLAAGLADAAAPAAPLAAGLADAAVLAAGLAEALAGPDAGFAAADAPGLLAGDTLAAAGLLAGAAPPPQAASRRIAARGPATCGALDLYITRSLYHRLGFGSPLPR
jgi:hypothetical protein